MRKIIFIITISFSFYLLNGQCILNPAFKISETLHYDAVYNWGFIWVNAGKVEFKVENRLYKGNSSTYLRAYGTSLKSYDWFFKVRDLYECFLDNEKLHPLYFNMSTNEGSFSARNKYIYNYNDSVLYASTENSDREHSDDTLKLKDCTFDVLSLIYYSRSLDFSGLNEGDKLPITVAIDNEIYDLFIRYLGREKFKTRDDKEYDCIKFSALLVEGTIFKGGEDLVVWVTDDKNRVPVQVEAKILVGSVKAILTDATNTLVPLKYRTVN